MQFYHLPQQAAYVTVSATPAPDVTLTPSLLLLPAATPPGLPLLPDLFKLFSYAISVSVAASKLQSYVPTLFCCLWPDERSIAQTVLSTSGRFKLYVVMPRTQCLLHCCPDSACINDQLLSSAGAVCTPLKAKKKNWSGRVSRHLPFCQAQGLPCCPGFLQLPSHTFHTPYPSVADLDPICTLWHWTHTTVSLYTRAKWPRCSCMAKAIAPTQQSQ